MKILHVLDRSLPFVAGYTSRAKSIVDHQRALGMAPVVVTGLRQPPSPLSQESIDGIVHHRTLPPAVYERFAKKKGAREIAEMAIVGKNILSVAREEGADLIHAHSPVLCGIPAHAAANYLKLPSVYEIRALWEDAAVNQGRDRERSPRYAAIRAMETMLCQRADAIVTICEGLRQDLLGRGLSEERVFVVPNGVDVSRFTPQARDEDLASRLGFTGKTVIAYIGTFFHFEGVPLLLEALGRLCRERDDVRGLIVGYGESEPDLRTAHERLGLGNRVVLAGKVAPDRVGGMYSVADVLCYPRERHRITDLTTPLKPLEAMSLKKAVVASDVGGLSELVDNNETGLLFKAGDVDALVAALRRVADDAAMRRALGERGRAHVMANRSWRVLAARYGEVYEAAREAQARRKGGFLRAA